MVNPSASIPMERTSSSYCPAANARRAHNDGNRDNVPSIRSRSIPISTQHMTRTPSEVQLYIDEAIAEHRDNMFYSRIVHGMMVRTGDLTDSTQEQRYQQCLARLARTRLDKFKVTKQLIGVGYVDRVIDEDDDIDDDGDDDWSPGLSEEDQTPHDESQAVYPHGTDSESNASFHHRVSFVNEETDDDSYHHEEIFLFEL